MATKPEHSLPGRIEFLCPLCHVRTELAGNCRGRQIDCPSCKRRVVVVVPGQAPESEAQDPKGIRDDESTYLDPGRTGFHDLTEMVVGFGRKILHAIVPAALTYVLAAIGALTDFSGTPQLEGLAPAASVSFVLLFTVGFAVLPAFFHAAACASNIRGPFLALHILAWYGISIVGLASQTGWLSLAAPALNIATAPKERRTWVFLQHGATSYALLFFITSFSRDALFPGGIVVVLGQSLLMAFVEAAAEPWWAQLDRTEDGLSTEEINSFLRQTPPRSVPLSLCPWTNREMLLCSVSGGFAALGAFLAPLSAFTREPEGVFLGVVFVLVGCPILFVTIRSRRRKIVMLHQGVFAQAVVCSLKETNFEVNGRKQYHVRLQYPHDKGQAHAALFLRGADAALALSRHEAGQTIDIFYHPADSRQVVLAEPASRWTSIESP